MSIVLQLAPASSRIPAWHAEGDHAHHANAECLYAGTVPVRERRDGPGGKPPCDLCRRLNRIDDQFEAYTIPFRF